ncbi:PadR family transcriptional regulator [Phytomonospora endophytica]|uniref:DNA-binding PadR family transcriptional regulator n=1 Tax=Phytomonospora endophytica TaxID=714109 RepID=A0A841FJH8_9ACTN|nr:PadR family transcriptional regulator [Phytomonospora endophytica]MBB6033307.1 DNA-binding PadR family transcriptional regulator [Phytomonospora endophytica]GIG65534.1 PadR family transcriptional regulator [Phytomonospora endophytica]
MWTTRLLILGLVRWLQPVHGYDVLKELTSWNAEDWAKIKPGSVYHGLKKLTTDGCLEVVSTEQVDKRPARTSYRVTAKGETEFQQVLREKLWGIEPVVDPFFVAWSFAPVLGPREAAAMLRNRAALITAQMRQNLAWLDVADSGDPTAGSFIPGHVQEAMRLATDAMRLTVDWCERVAVRAENGELGFDDERGYSEETIEHWRRHIRTLPDPATLRSSLRRGVDEGE